MQIWPSLWLTKNIVAKKSCKLFYRQNFHHQYELQSVRLMSDNVSCQLVVFFSFWGTKLWRVNKVELFWWQKLQSAKNASGSILYFVMSILQGDLRKRVISVESELDQGIIFRPFFEWSQVRPDRHGNGCNRYYNSKKIWATHY